MLCLDFTGQIYSGAQTEINDLSPVMPRACGLNSFLLSWRVCARASMPARCNRPLDHDDNGNCIMATQACFGLGNDPFTENKLQLHFEVEKP